MTISTDNEKEDISVSQFSADLLGNAEKHLVFLRALHQLGITAKFLDEASLEDSQSRYTNGMANSRFRGNDKAFVGESIRRYSRLWLPLVARAKKLEIDLIPPPDIAWMWHCHRLAPYRYAEHLRRENFTNNEPSNHSNNRRGAFSSMDPSHPFVFQLDTDTRLNFNDTWLRPDSENYPEIAKRTRALFEELYPTESFFGDSTPSASLHSDNTGAEPKLLSGFNVLDACQRQATFLWQVSGPSFSSERFLMDGISNYLRFVKLTNHPKRSYSHMSLVPTYQIDLIWHTHILSSIEDYHNDVRRITGGTVLDHDDSINDRTEGGILDTNFQQTSQLWKEVYGLDYFTKGGMYNGEPPADYFWGMPRADRHATADATAADPDLTRNNYSTIAALNWMSPNHRLAFIPLERDWYNPYKEDYVFGVGDRGMGYYHMDTQEANRVLVDRCQRKIASNKENMWVLAVPCIMAQAQLVASFVDGALLDSDWYDGFWIFYFLFGIMVPIYFCYVHAQNARLKQIKSDAWNRIFVEEGGYALHRPGTKADVGAAACGHSHIYRRGSGGGCGGGSCGGGGCGGGGCGGGGCGGGGCGG